jgi:hypothetical protein
VMGGVPPIGVKIRIVRKPILEASPVSGVAVNSAGAPCFFHWKRVAMGRVQELPLATPTMSFETGTKHYACILSSRNSYPQGENGPEGCTSFWASAAAKSRASIQLLAVGPCRDGRVSR